MISYLIRNNVGEAVGKEVRIATTKVGQGFGYSGVVKAKNGKTLYTGDDTFGSEEGALRDARKYCAKRGWTVRETSKTRDRGRYAEAFGQESEIVESAQIGQTILDQLGGAMAIKRMLGGKFAFTPKGVNIQWPSRHRSKGNWVEITLNPRDLYDVEFFNFSKSSKKPVKKYHDVHVSELIRTFEDQTGWILRAPRVLGVYDLKLSQ